MHIFLSYQEYQNRKALKIFLLFRKQAFRLYREHDNERNASFKPFTGKCDDENPVSDFPVTGF